MSELPFPAPAANPHLFGHERAEDVLLRAWRRGRLPHAWLLRGPRGVGKATLAYRFARRLLAGPAEEGRAAADPQHPVFRTVAKESHPDLRVLRLQPHPRTGKLTKEIGVEQVRAVEAALNATAARDGAKVLVVDEADDLSRSAANALLKLVEEPPPSAVVLLVCRRPGLLPATILSRCAQLSLAPLDRAGVRAGLAALAPDLPPERADLLVELAEGSIGRALALEATGWLEGYAKILEQLAAARGGGAARLALLARLGEWTEDRGFEGAVDLLGFLLRRLARLAAGRPPAAELCPGEGRLLRELAAGGGLDRWLALWDKLRLQAARAEELNLDPLTVLLQLVQGVCGSDPETELRVT